MAVHPRSQEPISVRGMAWLGKWLALLAAKPELQQALGSQGQPNLAARARLGWWLEVPYAGISGSYFVMNIQLGAS